MTSQRPHGRAKYVVEKCRCDECRSANARYEQLRLLHPTTLVDAEPVRRHVEMLRNHGIGTRQIAKLSGMPRQNVQALLYGNPPTRRMRPVSAARILALDAISIEPMPGATVEAVGATRRLQALACLGWSREQLAERLGLSVSRVHGLMTAKRLRYATITRILELYEELWDTTPPAATEDERRAVARSRAYAHRQGWAPPLAWDDDEIDDPAAQPAGIPDGKRRPGGQPKLPPADELRWLLEQESPRSVARRFGVRLDAIDNALRRSA